MAQDKDRKNLNVPPLRFPGFTDEWKTYSLSNFFDFKNGLNPEAKRFGQGIKFISVSDILNNDYIDYDRIIAEVIPTKKELEEFKVNRGDILFQRSSETLEDVGRANVYMDDRIALFGGFVIRGKKKSEYEPYFMRYALSAPVNRKKIIVKGAGAQHFNIGQDGLSKVLMNIPSIDEQTKIGHLLRLMDERIATQNKIIDNLQSLIKGLRERLFKECGSKYISLGEIAKLYQPKTIATSELEETGYLVYGANGVIGHYHSYNHEHPQICITCRGNTCGQVNLTEPFSWITGNAMVVNIEANENIDQSYLFHFLSSYNFISIISGSGQPQIVRSPLEKIKVPYHEFKEQKKISQILNSIANKIELEKNELRLLHKQKDNLLYNLFI